MFNTLHEEPIRVHPDCPLLLKSLHFLLLLKTSDNLPPSSQHNEHNTRSHIYIHTTVWSGPFLPSVTPLSPSHFEHVSNQLMQTHRVKWTLLSSLGLPQSLIFLSSLKSSKKWQQPSSTTVKIKTKLCLQWEGKGLKWFGHSQTWLILLVVMDDQII